MGCSTAWPARPPLASCSPGGNRLAGHHSRIERALQRGPPARTVFKRLSAGGPPIGHVLGGRGGSRIVVLFIVIIFL
jgi:hypothetical protein